MSPTPLAEAISAEVPLSATTPGVSASRQAFALAGLTGVALVALLGVEGPVATRTVLIGGACLVLWLTEVVPSFVPTLLLLGATPVLLGPLDRVYQLPS